MLNIEKYKNSLLNADEISPEIMQEIHHQKLFQIWVPKQYNGLGLCFSEGLIVLKNLAKIDGSLGWMITLCSGANYFSRNLKPSVAKEIFNTKNVCLGGSGMLGGTAKKVDKSYKINGLWHYATGAPHLTHFTLNAEIIDEINDNKSPTIKSFIIPRDQVKIIKNWNSMGMRATNTYSFLVEDVIVNENFIFEYDVFYTDDAIDRIPFRIFADLTLIVNYLGLAEHFFIKSSKLNSKIFTKSYLNLIEKQTIKILDYANTIENLAKEKQTNFEEIQHEIHLFCMEVLQETTINFINIYTLLGIKETEIRTEIHQIFRDFFTVTQHANFRNL